MPTTIKGYTIWPKKEDGPKRTFKTLEKARRLAAFILLHKSVYERYELIITVSIGSVCGGTEVGRYITTSTGVLFVPTEFGRNILTVEVA